MVAGLYMEIMVENGALAGDFCDGEERDAEM